MFSPPVETYLHFTYVWLFIFVKEYFMLRERIFQVLRIGRVAAHLFQYVFELFGYGNLGILDKLVDGASAKIIIVCGNAVTIGL